ncbi:MAG: hypothetical protein AAGH15_00390 [Myxococcota bacterium]
MRLTALGLLALACTADASPAADAGPTADGPTLSDAGPDADADAGLGPEGDADGDGITNAEEGLEADGSGPDTDGDGLPDGLDGDSDADGLADAVEGAPRDRRGDLPDSDEDGTPDFRDLDADDNGRPDVQDAFATDGIPGDLDGDGIFDFRDADDDGDRLGDVGELGEDPLAPRDTDADGAPDFRDRDSDGDTILDADELTGWWPEKNGMPVRSLDADLDGYPDRDEAGDDDPETPPVDTDGDGSPDFLDLDSDDDGVWDVSERILGLDRRRTDTDGDGTSDAEELIAGTDPDDGDDDPAARSWIVVRTPFRQPAEPEVLPAALRFTVPAELEGARVTVQVRDVSGGAEAIASLALDVTSAGCAAPSGLDTDEDGLPDAVASAVPDTTVCWTLTPLPNRTIPSAMLFPIQEGCPVVATTLDAVIEVMAEGEVLRSVTFKALVPGWWQCLAPDDTRRVDCPEPDPCNPCCDC